MEKLLMEKNMRPVRKNWELKVKLDKYNFKSHPGKVFDDKSNTTSVQTRFAIRIEKL